MDSSIRIVWYDLDDGDVDTYMDWLHHTHIPEVVSRPGIAWAAHYAIETSHDMMQHLIGYVGRPDDGEVVPTGDPTTVKSCQPVGSTRSWWVRRHHTSS